MSDENHFVIKPQLDLPTYQNPDPMISKINDALIKLSLERRQNFLRQIPSLIELSQNLFAGKEYRAVFSLELKRKLNSGLASLDKSSDGLFGAIIRESKTGHIIKHVKLEELPNRLISSLTQLAVQQSLGEIIQRMEIMDQKISGVLEGQRNDRLALIESGIDIYLQAIAANDQEFRDRLLPDAIGKLNEGRRKLILTLENDICFIDKIPRKTLGMLWYARGRDISDEIAANAEPIQQSIKSILRGSYVLASIYETLGENESLQASLQPLRNTLFKVGEKGIKIARFLPYDPIMPPEDFWHESMLELADGIDQTTNQLGSIQSKVIEIPFEISELGE